MTDMDISVPLRHFSDSMQIDKSSLAPQYHLGVFGGWVSLLFSVVWECLVFTASSTRKLLVSARAGPHAMPLPDQQSQLRVVLIPMNRATDRGQNQVQERNQVRVRTGRSVVSSLMVTPISTTSTAVSLNGSGADNTLPSRPCSQTISGRCKIADSSFRSSLTAHCHSKSCRRG